MTEPSEKPYIRYWARGIEDSPNARFFVLTPSGGEGNKLSPEEAGTRFRNYYSSNPDIELINGYQGGNDPLNRTLTELENERFLGALRKD